MNNIKSRKYKYDALNINKSLSFPQMNYDVISYG